MPTMTTEAMRTYQRERRARLRGTRTPAAPAVVLLSPVPIAQPERSTGAVTKPQTWQAAYAAHRGMTVDQVAQMLAAESPRETIERHITEALAEPSPHSNYYVTATDPGHRWTYGQHDAGTAQSCKAVG